MFEYDNSAEWRALFWMDRGFSVCLLGVRSKKPESEFIPPLSRECVRSGIPTNRTLGLHTGGSVIVLDIDVRKQWDGFVSIKNTMYAHRFAIDDHPTLTVRTPSSGMHLYYRLPEGFGRVGRSYRMLPGVDLLADDAVVVAPGETTESGRYEIVSASLEIAQAPEELMSLIDLYAHKGFRDYDEKEAQAHEFTHDLD